MLLLVMAGTFVPLIIGWGLVGAASYLLISFWFRRRTATRAGIKAFVINVVGDVGLVLGTYFIVFRGSGSLDFLDTFKHVQAAFPPNDGDLVAGCILLLVGAFAKSAQVPLHTWLPDAMEGPTPVSALIHAATMVTAGVYLIARMHPLFQDAPINLDLRPSFATDPVYEKVIHSPSDGLVIFGLVLSAVLAVGGIALAYLIWVRRPALAADFRNRFKPLYELSWHKWYFDELNDAVFVRPGATIGRFASNVFERVVVDGLVNGTVTVIRAGSAAVRGAQDGFLRVYAALLLVGLALVALWFLLQST
jgi:NADH:ubiquinone oxidoreductase subunit 5 (subunit L)/multisubunit Na+/H+ antiporter MnhA subunit